MCLRARKPCRRRKRGGKATTPTIISADVDAALSCAEFLDIRRNVKLNFTFLIILNIIFVNGVRLI